jgi:cytochrome c-type protein NapB
MLTALGLLLFAAGCGGDRSNGIPDEQIGLSKAEIFDVPNPDAYNEVTAEPGEGAAVDPAYDGAPPVINHGVADFLPITRDDNLCMTCHRVEEKIEGEPTPIPASHFTDYRNAPDKVGEEIAGARYNCLACHAPRTDAVPLVASEFGEGVEQGVER